MTAYLQRVFQQTWRQWNAFWFTAVEPTHLAVLRIALGSMLVYTHVVWGLAFSDFFGTTSWLDPQLVRQLQRDRPMLSFWWLVPAGWELFAHWLSLGCLVAYTVGFGTNITKVLAVVITISYANRTPTALFGLDQINSMLALYLAVGPCGARLSVDSWLRRHRRLPPVRPSTAANLSLRLIQLQMCLIYFYAGLSKLKGIAWWNGEAMWMAFANLEYQTFDMTWTARHPHFVNLLTHATVFWELTFCVFIWRPLLRPLVLVAGVLMHVGIGAMLGMWTFGLIMLVGCASFLPSDKLTRWFSPGRKTGDGNSGSMPATDATHAPPLEFPKPSPQERPEEQSTSAPNESAPATTNMRGNSPTKSADENSARPGERSVARVNMVGEPAEDFSHSRQSASVSSASER